MNKLSYHRLSNPSVGELPKAAWDRIKEILKTITLFVLSIAVFIFAVLFSAIGSSLLGIIYASKETIEYCKGLFQKRKLFSSLWRLFSVGVSAYGGWILGTIIGVAIFASGPGVIIEACLLLGWTVGLTALAVKYIPQLSDYLFTKKSDGRRDSLNLNEEDANTPEDLYENSFLLSYQPPAPVSYSPSSEASKPAIRNRSKGFFEQFFDKEVIQRNQDTQPPDCLSSAPSELILHMNEQSKLER